MKIKKLLDKLKNILDSEHEAQLEKYKSLKKVLKALRFEKTQLEAEMAETDDVQRQEEIASRLKIIRVQRKKGLRLLEDLKKVRKAQKL